MDDPWSSGHAELGPTQHARMRGPHPLSRWNPGPQSPSTTSVWHAVSSYTTMKSIVGAYMCSVIRGSSAPSSPMLWMKSAPQDSRSPATATCSFRSSSAPSSTFHTRWRARPCSTRTTPSAPPWSWGTQGIPRVQVATMTSIPSPASSTLRPYGCAGSGCWSPASTDAGRTAESWSARSSDKPSAGVYRPADIGPAEARPSRCSWELLHTRLRRPRRAVVSGFWPTDGNRRTAFPVCEPFDQPSRQDCPPLCPRCFQS